MQNITDAALVEISHMLKSLADPARLKIMRCLHRGECCVSEIVAETSLMQANVSKHLRILFQSGLLRQRKEATTVYYRIADSCVDRICEVVCEGYVKLMRQRIKSVKIKN